MNSTNPIILLEFNELCPELIERFISEGHLPNFKRLYSESQVYVTDAQEEQEYLEPWIQWVTVHTGLGYKQHGIFNLNDAHKLQCDSIWDVMTQAQKKVWLCGSMNIKYNPSEFIKVLPDPWSTGTPSTPEELNSFYRFVQVQVQEHTNTSVPLSKDDYKKFLTFVATHGLSFSSIVAIAKQILGEKLVKLGRWKRAVILDKLQWDVFQWYFKKYRPDFSTFFLNSTAHFQHKFWRDMEPEKFKLKPSDHELKEYGDAILFGYKEMDKIVGSALALAGNDTYLLFCSALSQQPFLRMEDTGGKRFYRPHRFEKFTEFLGLTGIKEVAPVMSEQFHIYFETPAAAQQAEQILSRVRIGNQPGLTVRRDGSDVFTGCAIFSQIDSAEMLSIADGGKSISFYELFYQADSVKSGMHHPDGIFWVRGLDRNHKVEKTRLPLREIAPRILNLMQLPVPAFMQGA